MYPKIVSTIPLWKWPQQPKKTAGELVLGHTILIEKCTHKMDYLQLSLPFSPGELQMGFREDALGQAG